MREQEDADAALGSLYGTIVFMAEKLDELDAIFMQYDMLVGRSEGFFFVDSQSVGEVEYG